MYLSSLVPKYLATLQFTSQQVASVCITFCLLMQLTLVRVVCIDLSFYSISVHVNPAAHLFGLRLLFGFDICMRNMHIGLMVNPHLNSYPYIHTFALFCHLLL